MGLAVDIRAFLGMVTIWGLQIFAYIGIMDNAANRSATDKSLVGGASLDLLAFVLFVQFGTLFLTPKLYWLLLILPPLGLYKLYATFLGGISGKNGATNIQSTMSGNESKQSDQRRQKRVEKRRQKLT